MNFLSQKPQPPLDDTYQAFIQEQNSHNIAYEKAVMQDVHAFALKAHQP